jgi:NAD(P)-dependent dehydrogenase (short-subunit alcohol dehydrogenase family)
MSTDTAPLALVAGGNRNPAHQLAAVGTDVIITYRTHEDEADIFIEALRSQGRRAEALRLDTANFPEFADAVRRLLRQDQNREHIDHLVNNAGAGRLGPFTDTTEQLFDEMYGCTRRACSS